MVITSVEAHVAPGQAAALEKSYHEATNSLPPEITQSFLVRDTADPTLWRIMTQWQSAEALEGYRKSTDTPTALRLFRQVGAEPVVAVFEVVAHANR